MMKKHNLTNIDQSLKNEKAAKHLSVALVLTPGWGVESPPYALALLAAILKKQQYGVHVFDINNIMYNASRSHGAWNWEDSLFWQKKESVDKYIADNQALIDGIVEQIVDLKVDVVGFSVYSTTNLMSIELAKRIKKARPAVRIVFGGAECDRRLPWENLLEHDSVDFLVFNEADETFPQLLEFIAQNKNPAPCKGIAYRCNGKIVDSGNRTHLKDLDLLPFADFSDFDIKSYRAQCGIVLKIATSRGCAYQCTYCSTQAVEKTFRTMSGDRIFKEIKHHIKHSKKIIGKYNSVYIFFIDLLLNANINTFAEWTSMLAEARQADEDLADTQWYGQIVLRDGMSRSLLDNIKQSGCDLLNYGVESGSPKVLRDMKKSLNIESMGLAMQYIHESGIRARGNFMVGFPTETEDDFEQTLDFLRKYGRYMDVIYPSKPFCKLERFSHIYDNQEEFDISIPSEREDLFWESQNGANNYIVRLDRYRRFCEVASSLSHRPTLLGVSDFEIDKWFLQGNYYRFIKKYEEASNHYKQYLLEGGTEKNAQGYILHCDAKHSQPEEELGVGNDKSSSLEASMQLGTSQEKQAIEDNARLNQQEFEEGQRVLVSSPRTVFVQAAGPCNADCQFCSKDDQYEFFNLNAYKERFSQKLFPYMHKAEEIVLTGSGEFLQHENAKEILQFFDSTFPYAHKMFSTNGSSLKPDIAEIIISSFSDYTIHVSLHASNARLHKEITRMDTFHLILGQLQHLLTQRGTRGNPRIHLYFVANTVNIEDLPNFIRLAHRIGADKVMCSYNYIYKKTQNDLSCFLKQDITNKVFKEAQHLSQELNMPLELPPFFSQETYQQKGICNEAWSQIMIDAQGAILPCDASGTCTESLLEKDFMKIWNGEYYRNLRSSLLSRSVGCFKHCFRANPASVNIFKSHIILRGKEGQDIGIVSEAVGV